MSKRVLVALSGGVDSSVAAALLVEQGYEVIGVHMHLWNSKKHAPEKEKTQKTCCSLDDIQDARTVCEKLNIPFYVLNFEKDFQENVIDYFTNSYLVGETPNPCVACNTFLKFDHLLNKAKSLNCEYVATGHYAQIIPTEWGLSLFRGVDELKDQSYFLYGLNQSQLQYILFPLGHLTKTQVRQIAESYGLINAKKKESMDICFVGAQKYHEFLEKERPEILKLKGEIRALDGRLLGEHQGAYRFTVGQRWGQIDQKRAYVVKLDTERQIVWVGFEEDLENHSFRLKTLYKVHSQRPLDECEVKVRYRNRPRLARLDGDSLTVHLYESVKAVTPGQIAVLYKGNEVLGGGPIAPFLHS